MYPVTDAFLAAVAGSHVVAQQVDVLEAGVVVATLETVVDGSVTEERADVRRRGDLELVDADATLTPDEAADLLAPYGNEVRPYRGVRWPDGSTELVPLGTLVIASVEIDWPTVRLSGFDRGWLAQQARFTSPYQVAKGTNVATAIRALLTDRLPIHVDLNLPTTAETTPLLTFDTEGDPWQAATELAAAIGMQLFPDRLGTILMTAESSLENATAVATFEEGEQGVLLGLSRSLNTEGAFNGVIAVGESDTAATPFRAEVWDEDPASQTYRYGKFGMRPRFYSSQAISSTTSAASAARAVLQRELGIADQVRFPALVNPALDVGDVINVTRAVSGVDARHVLDTVTVPLRAGGQMEAATRSRQTVL